MRLKVRFRNVGGANAANFRVALVVSTDSSLSLLSDTYVCDQLQALVALGIPAAEALRLATSVPARIFTPEIKTGVVREDAVADLLLVEGDPLQDIAATERIVAVWRGGRRVERRAPATVTTQAEGR